MTKSKKIVFSVILTIIILLIFELFSFSLFKLLNYDKKFNLYSEKRKSSLGYKYYSNVGLALPKPELEVIHYTKEFVDKFKTKDVLNLGFGLFDDGINLEKKKFAVAIGDSFTRGVGSGNNLKNGWVELVENELNDYDILNLGNLGRSVIDQKYGYDLLKENIKHELIIYNFFTGGDYYENTADNSASFFLNKKIKEDKLNNDQISKLVKNLQIYHGYDPSMEYLLDAKYRLFSLWLLVKISLVTNIDSLIPKNLFPEIYYKPYKDFNAYQETRMGNVSDEIYELGKEVYKNSQSLKIDNRVFHISKVYQNKNLANKIVDNSVQQIKKFIEQSLKENKKFILIIHPSQNDIYNEVLNKKISIDYGHMRERMIQSLKSEVPILDLTLKIKEMLSENKNLKFFWEEDGHYTPDGYKFVSKQISKFLNEL